MDNVEKFNLLVGLLLKDLQAAFHVPQKITGAKFLPEIINKNDFDGSWKFGEFSVLRLIGWKEQVMFRSIQKMNISAMVLWSHLL